MFQKAILAFALLLFTNALLCAEERTWTDVSGKYEFVASLVEVNEDGVLLKQANGETKLVPLAKLSVSDRAYAKAHEMPEQFEAVVANVSPKGYLMIVQNDKRHKIFIAGVKAPVRGQAYHEQATKYLKELVKGETVEASVVDRHNGVSCDLTVGGQRVDFDLLKNGFAWHDVNNSTDQQRQQFEDEARAAKLNLWSEPAAAPWEWTAWSKDERKTWLTEQLERANAARREVVFSESIKAVWPARVVGISDGDTVTALNENNEQIKIRLVGIDTPESRQAFGQKAKDALGAILKGREVVVLETGKDRYKRTLGFLELLPTEEQERAIANAEMVRQGFAWHYKAYSGDLELHYLEQEARAARFGLWGDSQTPVAPWQWRKQQKTK